MQLSVAGRSRFAVLCQPDFKLAGELGSGVAQLAERLVPGPSGQHSLMI